MTAEHPWDVYTRLSGDMTPNDIRHFIKMGMWNLPDFAFNINAYKKHLIYCKPLKYGHAFLHDDDPSVRECAQPGFEWPVNPKLHPPWMSNYNQVGLSPEHEVARVVRIFSEMDYPTTIKLLDLKFFSPLPGSPKKRLIAVKKLIICSNVHAYLRFLDDSVAEVREYVDYQLSLWG